MLQGKTQEDDHLQISGEDEKIGHPYFNLTCGEVCYVCDLNIGVPGIYKRIKTMKRQTYPSCGYRGCKFYKGFRKPAGIFFKGFIAMVEIHGLLCVTMSYVLAFMERTSIAEQLSSAVISEIIAPVVVLGATKTIENIFEKNILTFSTPTNFYEESEEIQDERDNI